MRHNIEMTEQVQQPEPEPAIPEPSAFSSRRAGQTETPGLRVMRDKKEMVRAFFENQNTAKV